MSADQPTPPPHLPPITLSPAAEVTVHPDPIATPIPAAIAPPETLPEPAAILAPEPTPQIAPEPTAVATPIPEAAPVPVSPTPAVTPVPAPPTRTQPALPAQLSPNSAAVDARKAAIAAQKELLEQKLAAIVARDRAAQALAAQSPSSANSSLPTPQPQSQPSTILRPRSGTPVSGATVSPDRAVAGTPVKQAGAAWSNSSPQAFAPAPVSPYSPPTTPPQLTIPLGRFQNSHLSLIVPLSIPAPVTSMFGWRTHPITGEVRLHKGVDFGAPTGTPVLAASLGRVLLADVVDGYGLTVVLRHHQDTQETLYAHLSEIFVRPGEVVKQGQVIGLVGSTGNSTGPHLHFEFQQLTMDGWVAVDPIDQLNQAAVMAKQPTSNRRVAGQMSLMLGLQGEVKSATIGFTATVTPLAGIPRPVPLTPTIVASFVTPSSTQPVSALVPLALSRPMRPELKAWVAPLLNRLEEAPLLPPTPTSARGNPADEQAFVALGQVPIQSNRRLPPPPVVPSLPLSQTTIGANRAISNQRSAVITPKQSKPEANAETRTDQPLSQSGRQLSPSRP